MRDLYEIANECKNELDALNVPYREVSIWKVNTRAKRRWGQCKHLPDDTYEININYDLLREENSLIGLKETIIHELIHTCPDCMNHGKEWNKWVAKVNKYYNYNIKRCSSAECKGVSVRRESTESYKYKIICVGCGRSYKYKRMCHMIDCCKKGYAKCCCGSKKFNVINL